VTHCSYDLFVFVDFIATGGMSDKKRYTVLFLNVLRAETLNNLHFENRSLICFHAIVANGLFGVLVP